MKKILFITIVTLGVNAKAQVTLEHTYDSAATYNVGGGKVSQLLKVKFEQSGERFVKINRWNQTICIYDLNHSLIKVIDCSTLPMELSTNKLGGILYLSENLFDTDAERGFFYFASLGNGVNHTGIYNDDASLIFSDTGAAWIYPGFPTQQYPIYNTAQGTKMILSYTNGQAKVFRLAGTLSNGIQEGNAQLMQAQGGNLNNLYPNPSTGKVTLQYELPKGEKEGEIILYNTQGVEVKRYKVDDTFNDLLLDNTQLPAGAYFYQLQTSKGAVGSKKMVVVR